MSECGTKRTWRDVCLLVRFRREADMPRSRVAYRSAANDPNVWSGRALQEDFSEWHVRSCINVSGLCLEPFVPRAIMDISAPAISLAVRPQWGHLGHQCSHAPGRPILHLVIFSQTSAG